MEKKLAHQLRDVTEATNQLYGNDLQIAERLFTRLLTFETQQSGFGLTATQDAHFNEVRRWPSNLHVCLSLQLAVLISMCDKHVMKLLTATVPALFWTDLILNPGKCHQQADEHFVSS